MVQTKTSPAKIPANLKRDCKTFEPLVYKAVAVEGQPVQDIPLGCDKVGVWMA